VRQTRSAIPSQEFAILQRDWELATNEMMAGFGKIAPVWADLVRKVVLKGEKYEEFQVCTRNLTSVPAQLKTFLQVTEFDDSDENEDILSIIHAFIAKSHELLASTRESQEERHSNLPVENFSGLSDEQVQNLRIDMEATILKLEGDLSKVRERLGRLNSKH
jgi:hypothetical protein